MDRLSRVVGHLSQSSSSSNADTLTAAPTAGKTGHLLDHTKTLPPDAIFQVKAAFTADKDASKVDLGIGAYRDNNGKPFVLKVVRKAEDLINKDKSLNHEYFPITGSAKFSQLAQGLMFDAKHSDRIASVQTLSGTGALRVAAEFVQGVLPGATVYLSNPTWGNHKTVMEKAGIKTAQYAYWDAKGRKLNYDGLLKDLEAAPEGSVIVLHACAHNPTGVDPTQEQWKGIAEVMKRKNHFPFFDSAYQGFASGDLENDAFAVKYFTNQGFDLLLCQSFAKNLGLYNERVGALHVLCSSPEVKKAVSTQLAAVIRPMYSNPPAQGARIVEHVLGNPELFAEWKGELVEMSSRINEMRKVLRSGLEKLGTPGTWEHITTQIGMFSYTGLNKAQALAIRSKWHVYMLENGRISMAGINTKNVEYLAKAIDDTVRNVQ